MCMNCGINQYFSTLASPYTLMLLRLRNIGINNMPPSFYSRVIDDIDR